MAGGFFRGGAAAASLLVNAIVAAALLMLGQGRSERVEDKPPLTILSLAAPKGSESAAREKSRPAENEAEAPQALLLKVQPIAAEAPAEPVAPATLPARGVSLPLPVPATASGAVQPSTMLAGSPEAPSAGAAAPKGKPDGLESEAAVGNSNAYAARVRSWLNAHKVYPKRAKMHRKEGVVRVRFVIDRAGRLIEGAIVSGSGNSLLDEEAVAMMRRASPYPKAPGDIAGTRLAFTVPIEFFLTS